MPAPFIDSRVYLKPLLPSNFKGDPYTVLKRIKSDLLRRVKSKLTSQTVFSERAKIALAKSFKVQIKPSSLVIISTHPAYPYLIGGQREGQMKWLTKADRPIPIVTEEGKLIFRNATARSMANGSWVHPGRKPSNFVIKAKEESRAFLKEKFKEELRSQVRQAVSKR